MSNKIILFLGLSLLILSASCASVPDAATTAKLLALHNAERAEIGLASLTWSADLASSAQKWANHLAANGGLTHSGTSGVGENLAKASFRKNLIEFLFSMWSNEKEYFDNSEPFPECSTTGNWGDVAHYTQIIWSKTYAVGCGIANTTASSVLVCQYKLAGNYRGNYVYLPSDIVASDPEEGTNEEETPVENDDNDDSNEEASVDDDSQDNDDNTESENDDSNEETPVDDDSQDNDDNNDSQGDEDDDSNEEAPADDDDSQGDENNNDSGSEDDNDDDSDSNESSSSSGKKKTYSYSYKKTYTRAYSYSTKKKN